MIDLLGGFNEWLNEVGYWLKTVVEGQLQTGSPLALFFVFLAGLVTSFTPCVYPMIPVTITFIGGSAGGNKRRAVSLSLVYVSGLAAVYACIGIVTGLIGKLSGQVRTFGTLSQSPWINGLVGLLILMFGLAMLDVFTIRVPMFFGEVQSKGARRGGHLGAFLMGIAAGFIAAPCTAPVLGLLLLYVAGQGSVVWGGTLLLSFSLGLGFLLLLVGIFSGMLASLPRSGAWMNWVKKGFGILMLAIGAFFLWKAVQVALG